MNKNKFIKLIIVLIGIFFISDKNVLAAWGNETAISYNLSEGRLYVVAEATGIQKIASLKVICNNREIAMSDFTGQEKNIVSLETSLDRLDEGENICKVKYITTKGKEFEKLNTLVYTRKAAVNDKSCSLILSGFDTDGGEAERNCKSKGCYWNVSDKLCSTYESLGFSDRYTLNSIIQSDIIPNEGNNNGSNENSNGNDNGNDENKTPPVAANFCADVKPGIKILGYIILVFKVLVPVIIIIMGTKDIYNVVTTGKSDDLKKQFILLGKRVIAGLIIFFLPTIINVVINAVDPNSESDYKVCTKCLFDPTNCN